MSRQDKFDIGRRIVDQLALAKEFESADDDRQIPSTSHTFSRNLSPPASQDASQSSDRFVHAPHQGAQRSYSRSSPTPIVSVQSIDSSSSAPSSSNPDTTLYAGLANYTFGTPRALHPSSHDAPSEATESIGPLTPMLPRMGADRTPRPSVSGQSVSPPLKIVSSHPSQGAGRPASSQIPSSHLGRDSTTRNPSTTLAANSSGSRSYAPSGTDGEESEDPSSSTDPITDALLNRQRARVMPDNASQHTFGHASRKHGFSASTSQDTAIPSSSSVSITTSRSSSRASMRTTEQFSSDDEVEIGYGDGGLSPITFANDLLVDIDEDVEPVDPSLSTFVVGRRGSLPIAIPGVVQGGDAYSARSREGSILTVRMASRSWDDTSTHCSSLSGEDPTVILPTSEPLSRVDWASLGAQVQARQQQAAEAGGVYDGLDLQYILSRRSEGSIRSAGSGQSFVHRSSASRISSFAPGSSLTLPIEDSFLRHLHKNDRGFDALRHDWSFVREKADPSISSGSSRRRRVERSRAARSDQPISEMSSRLQEMWRCGYVGRFKVDRLVIKPRSADPTKGAQQRIHIRNIPDPFLKGSTTSGPHSVIHKHSRAVAFSIFRSHDLFSSRKPGSGAGAPSTQTHMNMRHGIMLAPKKVQEQYTSTKTVRQINTHGLLDEESRSLKEKDKERGGRGSRRGTQSLSFRERDPHENDRKRLQDAENAAGKGKANSKGKGKDKSDKSDKKHRGHTAESADSSTATSSAGSVSNNTLPQVVSAPERPGTRIQFSPSMSSSTTVFKRDSVSRPSSPTLSLPPSSIGDNSYKISESDASSIPLIRHHRQHRDSIDSDDRFPARTPHAEAYGALDPNDIEHYRAKANSRANTESGSGLAKLFRVFRRSDVPSSSITSQPGAFLPPWMITTGRDQQEEHDRVLNDLNDSFREVGLLHTTSHKVSRSYAKRKTKEGILDQIPDDSLYMLLPLWAGETDTASIRADSSSTASFVTVPEDRQYLLVYYIPFGEATDPKGKKPEKKKAKQSHSSDSGVEGDAKPVYLGSFQVAARVVTYDDLRGSGVRLPSSGLAITGPEWEAISYPVSTPREKTTLAQLVCHCQGRERGFDFLADGLHDLGLCTKEEFPIQNSPVPEEEEEDWEREDKIALTPIGRAAVEMIWLGCLALTSFGPS